MYDRLRLITDRFARRAMLVVALATLGLSLAIGGSLYIRAAPLFDHQSLGSLLTSSAWSPAAGQFGFLPFIAGTGVVTAIAIAIAFPLALLGALFLEEYAPYRLRETIRPLFDLLSAIPPIVFGVWGVLFIVPLVKSAAGSIHGDSGTGYSVLAGGIVLAIMIVPLLSSLLLELFRAVSRDLRDASLSLGATRWQTIKFVLLRKTLAGIIAATILALSRAIGETLAVLIVCGNVPEVPRSLLGPGYPLPALIANNYGEMMSIPDYDAALMFAALLLFVIILGSNTLARITLRKVERRLVA